MNEANFDDEDDLDKEDPDDDDMETYDPEIDQEVKYTEDYVEEEE